MVLPIWLCIPTAFLLQLSITWVSVHVMQHTLAKGTDNERENMALLAVLCGWVGAFLYLQHHLGGQDANCFLEEQALRGTGKEPYNNSFEAGRPAREKAKEEARQELKKLLESLPGKMIPADQIEKLLQGARMVEDKTETVTPSKKVAIVTLAICALSPPPPRGDTRRDKSKHVFIPYLIGAIGAPIVLPG